MLISQEEVDSLLARPSETRSVELKAWIDPASEDGKVKILTALLALRNFNGGRLLVGFDDQTQKPLPEVPSGISSAFQNDTLQLLVSRHASESFDVQVCFGELNGQRHPVIAVAAGVKTPVAVKTPVTDKKGAQILRKGPVFFRTLNANGVVSSAEAQPSDWPELMQICMDNREADIGRFIRRHLAGTDIRSLLNSLGDPNIEPKHPPDAEVIARQWLVEASQRFERALSNWPAMPYPGERPDISALSRIGAWEVALVISPPLAGLTANDDFYRKVASSNPGLSGWPVWLETRSHALEASRHRHIEGGWEALVVSRPSGFWDHLEFQRWEPRGRFYLRRLFDDDASAEARRAAIGQIFDLGRAASRVAESIVTGISIAKGLGCKEQETALNFAYRWTGLSGRALAFWASQVYFDPFPKRSADYSAQSFVSVPLSTAPTAITPFVVGAIEELAAKFDGFTMPNSAVEKSVQLFLGRRT